MSETLNKMIKVLSGWAFPSDGFNQLDGLPLIRIRDLGRAITEVKFRGSYDQAYVVQDGDVLIGMDGDFSVKKWAGGTALLNQRVCKVQSTTNELDQDFLYWYLMPHVAEIHRKTPQTTVRHLSAASLFNIVAPPISMCEQRVAGAVLDTIDSTIRQTEAIIEKLKQVKQGLLHDLLTRGIDANGELRPPQCRAPHLYNNSPLGWIPHGWSMLSVGQIAESIVDGPFGSNLKTEHYVELPGVRVVRLQNLDNGEYDDTDRAYVSVEKAAALGRNEVLPGDVLVAALGDERYPVGRACSYPMWLPKAINKADCFRLRPEENRAIGEFIVHSLNGAGARRQIKSFEQGVTLQRINIGNLRKIRLPLPTINEQMQSCEKLAAVQHELAESMNFLVKSRRQKIGLMDDLLTGRVRVTALLGTLDA